MKLWLVHDRDRWGYGFNVVRAESAEGARALVCPGSRPELVDVVPLPVEGPAGVVWCHGESPDTPR